MRKEGAAHRIHVVVIDWTPEAMPDLLVFLAAADEVSLAWARRHQPGLVAPMRKAFEALQRCGHRFEEAKTRVAEGLVPALVSHESAKRALKRSYFAAFRDRDHALRTFRQVITPLAPARISVDRTSSLDRLDQQLLSLKPAQMVVVLGEEGVGKTWFVADYWRSRAPDAFFVLITSQTAFSADLKEGKHLAEHAIRSALYGAGVPAGFEDPWPRKPSKKRPILVVLDGLNERPSLAWRSIIREMRGFLDQIGGKLILTCRPRFWAVELESIFAEESRLLLLPGFDDDEFEQAMRSIGRDPGEIAPALRGDLRNPRLFSLAANLLSEFKDGAAVTRERVLWHYWRHRKSERDDIALSDQQFKALLTENAEAARKEIVDARRKPDTLRGAGMPTPADVSGLNFSGSAQQIYADLNDVVTSQFFRPNERGFEDRYVFVADKLWFALGLRLAVAILEEFHPDDDLHLTADRIAKFIEPLSQMDVAADILAAAFAVSAMHPRMAKDLSATFLIELIEQRNRFGDGVSRCRQVALAHAIDVPHAYIVAADYGVQQKPYFDEWIVDALRRVTNNEKSRPTVVTDAIHRWLSNVAQPRRYPPPRIFQMSIDPDDSVSEFGAVRPTIGLALRILAGVRWKQFAADLERLVADGSRPAEVALVAWFDILDSTGVASGRLAGAVAAEIMAGEQPSAEPYASNNHLKYLLTQLRTLASASVTQNCDGDALDGRREGLIEQEHEVILSPDTFEKPWNIAYCPSLAAGLDKSWDDAFLAMYNAHSLPSDPGEVFHALWENRVLDQPISQRATYLSRFSVDSDEKLSILSATAPIDLDDTAGALICEAASDISRLRSVLEFLQRLERLNLDAIAQDCLVSIIRDPARGTALRRLAVEVAQRCVNAGVARRLAATSWSPLEEDGDLSIPGSNLLAQAVDETGIYSRIRSRLAPSSLALVIEFVSPEDLELAAGDLGSAIDASCDNAISTGVTNEPAGLILASHGGASLQYLGTLTLNGALRLGREQPDRVRGWAGKFERAFENLTRSDALETFAYSILPAYAAVDPALAGRHLRILCDRGIQANAHENRQGTIEHVRIRRAMSLPQDPLIDAQIIRLLRAMPDDESLSIAVEAACEGGREKWLKDFVLQEGANGTLRAVALARYLAALAGFSTGSISGRGSPFLDAVEARAAALEADRSRFLALRATVSGAVASERLQTEMRLFDALTGYHTDLAPTDDGDYEKMLCSRLILAREESKNRLSSTLFGLAAPPSWLVYGNDVARTY